MPNHNPIMNILVCISHVPDTTAKINFTGDGKALDPNGVQFVINPYDEFGLTKALHLKEAHGGTITVINVGLAATEPTLRKALAIGGDKAVRINANPEDAITVAKELKNHIEANSYDLIICGQESIDYNGQQVPAMIAAMLKLPFANACVGLTINSDTALATSEIDGGHATFQAKLPMIVGGKKGLVEEKDLRIPNMRGIMSARTKPLELVEPSVNDGATKALHFEKPAPKAAVKMVDAGNVDELVRLLHEEAKAI
jgi:electron transfer flavoprotein beta subunit